jgi:hypothetical protein
MSETVTLKKWLVTLRTPNGDGEIVVPSTMGPEAAGRRAHMAASAIRWGDLDEIEVLSVVELIGE